MFNKLFEITLVPKPGIKPLIPLYSTPYSVIAEQPSTAITPCNTAEFAVMFVLSAVSTIANEGNTTTVIVVVVAQLEPAGVNV